MQKGCRNRRRERDRKADPQRRRGDIKHRHGAVCLETQNWPDAINRAGDGFPNAVLRSGETYKHEHEITFFTL